MKKIIKKSFVETTIEFLFSPFRKYPYFMLSTAFIFQIMIIIWAIWVDINMEKSNIPEIIRTNGMSGQIPDILDVIIFRGPLAGSIIHLIMFLQIFFVLPFVGQKYGITRKSYKIWRHIMLFICGLYWGIFFPRCMTYSEIAFEFIWLQFFWINVSISIQFLYHPLQNKYEIETP